MARAATTFYRTTAPLASLMWIAMLAAAAHAAPPTAPRHAALRGHVRHHSTTAAPAASPAATASPTPAAQGLRVFMDPETGTLGGPANAAQQAELSSSPATSVAQPVVQHMPDGSLMMVLDGFMEDYIVVQLDAKGHRVMRCVSDLRQLQKSVVPAAGQTEDR